MALAFDLIGRQPMLSSLLRVPRANSCLPFARLFYGQPSEYQWFDSQGQVHTVLQAEGGEPGDPLMPALYPSANTRRYSTFKVACYQGTSFRLLGRCACHMRARTGKDRI